MALKKAMDISASFLSNAPTNLSDRSSDYARVGPKSGQLKTGSIPPPTRPQQAPATTAQMRIKNTMENNMRSNPNKRQGYRFGGGVEDHGLPKDRGHGIIIAGVESRAQLPDVVDPRCT